MDPITIAMALASFAPKIIGLVTHSDTAATNAQKVLDIAKQVTGTATPDAAVSALTGATPEVQAAFRAEIDRHAEAMATIEQTTVQAELGDTANARNREIAAHDSWTPRALACAVFALYAFVQWFTLAHIVPAENRDLVTRGMGILDMSIGLVLGYYFGSSNQLGRK